MNHRNRWLAGAAAILFVFANACSGENQGDSAGASCSVAGATQACGCADGTQSVQACTNGTWGACACSATAEQIPCSVQTVLQNKCYSCHGAQTQFGAPSFTSINAFRVPATQNQGATTVAALAADRIVNPSNQMPPASVQAQLTAEEKQLLTAWFTQGAPRGDACAAPAPTGTGTTPAPTGTGTTPAPTDTGTTPAPTDTGTTPLPTSTGTTPAPVEDVKCYKIVARANTTGAKYAVPNTPDYYNCFSWAVPWGNKKVHIVKSTPIIDNTQVIHHWILYNNAGAVQDGASARCSGAHPDAAFIAGWAPGGGESVMPPDVGLGVNGAGFTLEAHYNARSAGQQDASGVELCVTEQLRKNEAAVHWLGTQNLNKIEAVGQCRPALTQEVHILSSSPHMHVQGRHMKTVINRAAGGQEILIDKPFDFNTQVTYETPAIIKPGDTLTTTCTYAQPTPFGQGTNQEMCYNFVSAYPAGLLTNGVSFIRQNDCTN